MSQYGSPGITAQMLQQSQSLPMTTGGDVNGISSNINAMAGMGQFDQTFNNVPQDLWKMPMTLEWDWADMTGGFSGYEDGISMNGVLPDFSNQSGHGTSEFNQGAMNGGR
jgi:hypothetical protein